MLQKFQNHIHAIFPYLKGKKLLLAISGGIDSIVLLDLCFKSKLNFAVAHCNFQLRGVESNEDEIFIKNLCDEKNISTHISKFETKKYAQDTKLSIQVAARNLRYAWFYELLENQNYQYIITAHHLDDSLETFFINLSRGTGLDGLTGIPATNDKLIRPLLIFSRNDIINYAIQNKIDWREDSSNNKDNYLRNNLRHNVIPQLKELQPNFLHSFQKTINHLQQVQLLLDDASQLVYKIVAQEKTDSVEFNLDELLKLPNYKAYLYQWLKEYKFTAWNDIYDLVNAQSGKKIFSDKYVLIKNRNQLVVYLNDNEDYSDEFFLEKNQLDVKIPINLLFCTVHDKTDEGLNTIFVDENKVQFPLVLRRWKEGDFFYPMGMIGKKKVSKFFKDEKFSLLQKQQQWILCSNNKIVWIIGLRQDDRFKITEKTTTKLMIKIQ